MADIAENITLSVDGGSMRGYLARPDTEEPRPAIVVVQEIMGVTPHIEDVARRFAAEGYVALAPDLFWEIGSPPDFTDRSSFMRFRLSLDDRKMLACLDATVAHLQGQPYVDRSHIGIIGFCMGGYYALLEATRNPGIAAVADFYGAPLIIPDTSETRPRSPMYAVRDLHVPFLGIFGAEDQSIPVEQVQQLESVLREVGVPLEIEIYQGAGHAFHNDTGAMYREDAAKDAWQRTLRFFGTHLRN
jgi:carboxymethylenebutenolidase